jgi:hypothetical protein
MRKGLIAMLIAFSFAVVSCGGAKEETVEETPVEVVESPESTPVVEEGEVVVVEEAEVPAVQ